MVPGKRIGLFFGSFNPVHTGHMIIAEFMANQTGLDQVWLIVSPQNPLKHRSTLANDYDRLHLVQLAIDDNIKLRASNIEFSLPKPSYTVDTMTYLHEKYPEHEFSLIMGSDNLVTLEKWKNYEVLLERYPILVYDRTGSENTNPFPKARIRFFEVPLINISSTYIREQIKAGRSIRYLVPDKVFEYLQGSTIYRQ